MMTGDGLLELRRRTTLVRGINPRGARHWGSASRHQTCMRQVRSDPDPDAVMRIGGEAPGGGPILSVGISAMVRLTVPATSDPQFGSPRKAKRERRMVLSGIVVPVSPFRVASERFSNRRLSGWSW